MPIYSARAEEQMRNSEGRNARNFDLWNEYNNAQRQQTLDRGTLGLDSQRNALANDARDFAERARQFNATQDNSRYALDQSNSLARDLMGQRTNAFQAMLSQGNGYQFQPMPQPKTPPWMSGGQSPYGGDMNNALIKMLLGQMGG